MEGEPGEFTQEGEFDYQALRTDDADEQRVCLTVSTRLPRGLSKIIH